MKTWIFLCAVALGGLSLKPASAQVHVNVNLNVGTQPEWGPVGYSYVRYYYLPDIDAYYDVPSHQFIYLQGNHWVFAASLPPRYRDYDLYRGYKVVVDADRPYLRDDYYRRAYGHYRGYYGHQPLLRDHREDHGDDQGHGHAWGHDKDHGDDHGHGHGRGHDHGD